MYENNFCSYSVLPLPVKSAKNCNSSLTIGYTHSGRYV
ncbi:unnamed protein product [Acanthoscelides obtectus]|uniref:Uncharacterized protein n=1 Tax=Acanthoscelides obtectus TaxID=200917 RepID=A0A9P0L0S2_ACAOB|nr:unnamed protein product [Acanthoscelides obtectus]CAK1648280.1 hypothetical protein AOBTE_LOCUS15641 [Acanthoscelides obtectus]